MLTFIVHGATHQISAHQFSELVAVAVRLMKDASQGTGVDFNLAGLHASAPTIQWQPVTTDEPVDVDMQFVRIIERLEVGIGLLESQAEVPDWMNESTARRLHEVAKWFGESEVDGVTFVAGRVKRRLTRETYLTLDRWLHEESEAIGSVTGTLMTATLRGGPHVSIQDEVHGRSVEVSLTRDQLRAAGQWIGLRVTAAGRMKRDFAGRPKRIAGGSLDLVPERTRVTASEASRLYRSGPPVVNWLRAQRDA